MNTTGIIEGNIEYLWAAYGVAWTIYSVYAVSLFARWRKANASPSGGQS